MHSEFIYILQLAQHICVYLYQQLIYPNVLTDLFKCHSKVLITVRIKKAWTLWFIDMIKPQEE